MMKTLQIKVLPDFVELLFTEEVGGHNNVSIHMTFDTLDELVEYLEDRADGHDLDLGRMLST